MNQKSEKRSKWKNISIAFSFQKFSIGKFWRKTWPKYENWDCEKGHQFLNELFEKSYVCLTNAMISKAFTTLPSKQTWKAVARIINGTLERQLPSEKAAQLTKVSQPHTWEKLADSQKSQRRRTWGMQRSQAIVSKWFWDSSEQTSI